MIPRIRARRRGFTLVELMLVVALMAVLVALSTGAYFRIRASELIRATEATESKLNMLLDKRWTGLRAQASEDLKASNSASQAVLNFAGGDQDRARVIMTYLKFKNEFPTTIAEACTPIAVNGTVVYQPRSVFTAQFGGVGATGLGTPEESAALFYLAITATGNRGETAGPDGTANQTGDVSITVTSPSGTQAIKSMQAYMDSWGNPIMFIRQAYTPELNNPPYVRAGVIARDMADPPVGTSQVGRLVTFTPAGTPPQRQWTTTQLQTFWAIVTAKHIQYAWPPGTFPAGFPNGYPMDQVNPTTVAPWNWVPTLISAGPNKNIVKPTANPSATGNPWDPVSPDGFFEGDNLVSYRLRREGNRGN